MVINVSAGDECRIAVLHEGRLEELFLEREASQSHVGNIYKGRVTNIESVRRRTGSCTSPTYSRSIFPTTRAKRKRSDGRSPGTVDLRSRSAFGAVRKSLSKSLRMGSVLRARL